MKRKTKRIELGLMRTVVILLLQLVVLIPIASIQATEMDFATTTITFVAGIIIDDVTVFEGETALFTIELGMVSDEVITVDYSTSNGSAVSGVDYSSRAGTVTFLPGEKSQTVSVPTLEDEVGEPDEIFYVDLSNPTGPAVIADPRGVGTILDDEGGLMATINDDEQYEGDVETFTVQLSDPADSAIRIGYTTRDETASSVQGDYEPTSGTLLFTPGETVKTIDVPTYIDDVEDPDETFNVVLEVLTGDVTFLEDGIGVGTILERTLAGGGAGGLEEETCTPICPPIIPLVKAKQSDELVSDLNGNGIVDPGDTLKYKIDFKKVEPSNFQDLLYVGPLSPHLQYVEGSLKTSSGQGSVKNSAGRQVVYVDFSKNGNEGGNINFPLEITFRARVNDSLSETVNQISIQGTVYSVDSPTVVTDDPDTLKFDDPTATTIGDRESTNDGNNSNSLIVEKEVLSVRDELEGFSLVGLEPGSTSQNPNQVGIENRIISSGSLVGFRVTVINNLEYGINDFRLIDTIDKHLTLQTNSLKLDGKSVKVSSPDETGLMSIDIPGLDPGKSTSLTYWVEVKEQLHPDIGHLGTNAYVAGPSISTQFSDDPETELSGDRTALLLHTHCNEENYLDRWERWLERISQADPTLSPVILSPGTGRASGTATRSLAGSAGEEKQSATESENEEEDQDEISWVLFGNRNKAASYFGEGTVAGGAGESITDREKMEDEVIYRDWPRYSFFGVGELNVDPNEGQLFVGLNTDSSVAGGAGGVGDEGGNVYVQKYPDLPVYSRLSGNKMNRLGLSGVGAKNICGKEYLPYIMDTALTSSTVTSSDEDRGELINVFKVEE